MCLREARAGGESRLVSSVAVYNEIARSRPDLLEPLFAGYPYHWFGEQPPGQGEVTDYPVPVFGDEKGRLSCIFLRAFIDMAAEATGLALDERQSEALDVSFIVCESGLRATAWNADALRDDTDVAVAGLVTFFHAVDHGEMVSF